MRKYGQSSIWDNLIRIMPELKHKMERSPDYVDPIAAKSLYNIWRTGSQNKEDKVFKKPTTLSKDDVDRMKKAGLVKTIGDNIEITTKGEKTIRVMILGDDRSIFEDNGIPVDYNTALNQTKGVKTAKRHKAASSWWSRFEKKSNVDVPQQETRDEYTLTRDMLLELLNKNLIHTLDAIDYQERIQPSFKNKVVKEQVMMHIKSLYNERIGIYPVPHPNVETDEENIDI